MMFWDELKFFLSSNVEEKMLHFNMASDSSFSLAIECKRGATNTCILNAHYMYACILYILYKNIFYSTII